MKTLTVLAILATIALGVVVGVLYLQRARRKTLADAHLILAMLATAMVLAMLLAAPAGRTGGPPGLLPLVLLAAATAVGWGAGRISRGRRGRHNLVIAAHALGGIAGFFTFLAWAKGL